MKKLFLGILCICQVLVLSAQNKEIRNTVSLQTGASLFGPLRRADATPPQDVSITFTDGNTRVVPTIQAAWDYGIANWFSIGIAGSFNSASINFRDVSYESKPIGDVRIGVSRTSLAVRPLFHYGNKGRFDMYTGFRLGVGLWTASVRADVSEEVFNDLIESIDTEIPSFVRNRIDGGSLRGGFSLPSIQFIPFGLRYYVTENIGLNGELAIGPPYYASIGANFRF